MTEFKHVIEEMKLEIAGMQLIDNTWQQAERVERELCAAMAKLIEKAYYMGKFGITSKNIKDMEDMT